MLDGSQEQHQRGVYDGRPVTPRLGRLDLSIFGTYVSSISFLANPGKSYGGNWNPFVFSLSLPIAAWLAVRYFVPFYRNGGQVSAYHHLALKQATTLLLFGRIL